MAIVVRGVIMNFEIIDFHTHPFTGQKNNICNHKEHIPMDIESTRELLQGLGITTICGSVVEVGKGDNESYWDKIRRNNRAALELKDAYGDFYVPGFHVHPDFIDESINEMKLMHSLGFNLIGELVPYMDGWKDYSCEGFSVLLDQAAKYNMIVSFHSIDNDNMDKMVQSHKDVIFVAAHPGEYPDFMRHVERAKKNENYYLDLSGTGLFRHGMLRRAIDEMGVDRILFGSDYPTCNPAMFVGGVVLDSLITDSEKEKILSGNAKRLLGM